MALIYNNNVLINVHVVSSGCNMYAKSHWNCILSTSYLDIWISIFKPFRPRPFLPRANYSIFACQDMTPRCSLTQICHNEAYLQLYNKCYNPIGMSWIPLLSNEITQFVWPRAFWSSFQQASLASLGSTQRGKKGLRQTGSRHFNLHNGN